MWATYSILEALDAAGRTITFKGSWLIAEALADANVAEAKEQG